MYRDTPERDQPSINGWTPRAGRLTWQEEEMKLEAREGTWGTFQTSFQQDGHSNGMEIPAEAATSTLNHTRDKPDDDTPGIIIRGWIDGQICMTNFCLMDEIEHGAAQPLQAFALRVPPSLFRDARRRTEGQLKLAWQIDDHHAHCTVGDLIISVRADTSQNVTEQQRRVHSENAGELRSRTDRTGPGGSKEPERDDAVFAITITALGRPIMLAASTRLTRDDGEQETLEDFTQRIAPEIILRTYIANNGGPDATEYRTPLTD